MRLLLCGGGTAGHVNPALAIGETVEKNISDCEIAYVVTKNGIENKLVPYKKYVINVTGLKKKFNIKNIKSAILLIKGINDCKKIIKEFSPDIVIGTGGYSCFPVIYAASKMGIKTIIHESNAYPGKSTRLLSRYADRVLLNCEESIKYFENSGNISITGNPFLIGFLKGVRENKESNEIVILCFGGSLGAEKINDCAYLICKNILTERKNVKFVWGCGKREYQRCKSMLENINVDNVELKEYIYNMPEIISTADIVICRSGAMSVAEMSYSGKCTVFIPSPNVTDNHQFKNAKVLSDKNAAILVEEKDIDTVIPILNELIDNKNKRDELEIKIAESCIRDSNKRILNEIKKVSKS
jgi:UDP-N-acetylglucosamine--N-acetylmuramyl-(pentapeptide) pyrophosphoryl-undecaprenol N-acetylglucosamine transferase